MQVYWRGRGTLGSLLSLLIGVSTIASVQVASAQQVPKSGGAVGPKATGLPQLALQQGHTQEVQSMVFSPDSTLLATAGQDGEVKLWDLRTGEQRRSFTVDASWAVGLAISPDGQTLASFVRSGKALLYDIASGRLLRTLDNGSEPAAIAFSPDGTTLALGGQEASCTLWNYRTGKRLRAFSTHVSQTGEVSILAFSPNGSRVACAAGDAFGNGNVEIWDVDKGSLVTTLNSKNVHSVAFSPDGKTVALGCGGFVQPKSGVELWDLAQHKVIKRLSGKEFDPISVGFSADGRHVAAGDAQGLLILWDIATGTALHTMGVPSFVVHAAVGPGARLGAGADHNGTVRIYTLETGQLLRQFSTPAYSWNTARFAADGASLVLGGGLANPVSAERKGRNVLLSWDLLSGNWKDLRLSPGYGIYHADLSASGVEAVTLDREDQIEVWNLQPDGGSLSFPLGKHRVISLAVSPTEPTVVFVGDEPKERPSGEGGFSGRGREPLKDDPFLEMIDTRTGKTIRTLKGHTDLVNGVNYSADGSHFVTLSYDRSLILWNAHTGEQEKRVPTGAGTPGSVPECLAVSRDGRLAAIGYEYAPVQVMEISTGRVVRSFPLPSQITGTVALSPESDWVAAGGGDGTVRAWNIRTGQAKEMRAGNHALAWVGFAPQGTHLAGLDRQGFLRLWDVPTGQLLVTFQMVGPQDWIAYTPEGYYEGSAGVDKFLRWRVGNEILPAERYRAQFYRPDLVQTRLSGKPQPERYAQLLGREETLRHTLNADDRPTTRTLPIRELNPANTALKRVLNHAGNLTDPATRKRVLDQIQSQLEAGADPNLQTELGTSPLMFLVACGDSAGVRALLDRKVNVNLVDVYGRTALLEAVSTEHQDLVPLLLAVGADLKDEKGNSLLKLQGDRAALSAALIRILMLSAYSRNAPVLNFDFDATAWMLLYLGADPNVRNAEGEMPIMHAAYPYLMKALLAKGADPNARDKRGAPVIEQLSMGDQIDLVRMLLDAKADPNGADSQGWNALMFAAQNGHTDLAKLLLERGANPSHVVKDGRTPLMMAIGDGYLEITQALLAHGAQVNGQDGTGWTPLMYAVNRKDATTVKLLLSKGADIHVRNEKKQTLLQQITALDPHDTFGVARILKEAGAR